MIRIALFLPIIALAGSAHAGTPGQLPHAGATPPVAPSAPMVATYTKEELEAAFQLGQLTLRQQEAAGALKAFSATPAAASAIGKLQAK